MFLSLSSQAVTLDATEMAVVESVSDKSENALVLLEELVNINSGTMNFAGVKQVADIIAKQFTAIGFETEWIDLTQKTNRAGHLIAKRTGNSANPHLLLIGHLDTVFTADSEFQTFTKNGTTLSGPGVVDMKGGILVMLTALQALAENNLLDDTNITIVLNGDEESAGEPEAIARAQLIEAAQQADYALSFEFARDLNSIINARRGYTRWTLIVDGVSNHSSRIFSTKKDTSAIYEAARILHTFDQTFNSTYGLAINPGIIVGGSNAEITDANTKGYSQGKRNIIARKVMVHGDLRYITNAQRDTTKAEMQTIVMNYPGQAKAVIEFDDSKPAFAATSESEALLNQLSNINVALGLDPIHAVDPINAGAGDINYISDLIPGIDGLGPVGDGLHSTEETMDVTSFPLITQRTAILIYRLTNQPMIEVD